MYTIISEYLEKIAEAIGKLEEANRKVLDDTSQLLFAYRGEPRDYGDTKLTPSLFRDKKNVLKERYLFDLLQDYNVIEDKRYIEKMIDAQHYASLSRALDITFNALVALYFASDSGDDKRDLDGYVFVFCFPKYISPHSCDIEELYKKVLNGRGEDILDKNFIVISHAKNNERINAQSGGFIFFPGEKNCNIRNIYYNTITIDHDDKKQIRIELERLFGINAAKMFPEKSTLAEQAKRIFERTEINNSDYGSVKEQIKRYFERLDYELEYLLTNDDGNNMKQDIMRILRKEKDDLEEYVNRAFSGKKEDERHKLIEFVKEKINELRSSKEC